jgi:hypothetical protein
MASAAVSSPDVTARRYSRTVTPAMYSTTSVRLVVRSQKTDGTRS